MPAFIAFVFIAALAFGSMAAWITHIVACIGAGAWILLLIGAFIVPVGVIHGVMVWCGMSWVPM